MASVVEKLCQSVVAFVLVLVRHQQTYSQPLLQCSGGFGMANHKFGKRDAARIVGKAVVSEQGLQPRVSSRFLKGRFEFLHCSSQGEGETLRILSGQNDAVSWHHPHVLCRWLLAVAVERAVVAAAAAAADVGFHGQARRDG